MSDSHHLILIFVINFMTALCSFIFRITTMIKQYDYATPEFNLVLDTLMGYSTLLLMYMTGIVIYECCTGTNGTVRRHTNRVSVPSSQLTGYLNHRWP